MSDTPTATAAPRMTQDHVEAVEFAIPMMGEEQPLLDEIASLISDLVSGKRDTFDTETEVKVSRRELEQLNRALHSVDIAVTAFENASQWTARWLTPIPDETPEKTK